MRTPFTCVILWTAEKTLDPAVVDGVLARDVLRRFTTQPIEDGDEVGPSDGPTKDRSLAVAVLPVKSRAAALTPPHVKIDPLTVAQWLIADVVRSLRIATDAPLRELHYPALPPIVPAVFGAGGSVEAFRFDDDQYALVLDHIADPIVFANQVDHSVVGQVFHQLTYGSVSALIRDHIGRAHAELVSGDRRAAILSLAVACELLLDTGLAAMMWEEGLAAVNAAEHWGTSSVTRRVKRLYAERLGGSCAFDGFGPVAEWRRQVATVRNTVIHTGRGPSKSEVDTAGVAAGEVTTFVSQRLIANWRTYPEDDLRPPRTIIGLTARRKR